jgi:hypothetical protein
MKKKKQSDWLYISGKITDNDPKKQLANLRKFDDKATELKGMWANIFNPATLETGEDTAWEVYLARDLKFIFENRPDIMMLKHWEQSKGAKLERAVAKILGLNIFYEELPETFKK